MKHLAETGRAKIFAVWAANAADHSDSAGFTDLPVQTQDVDSWVSKLLSNTCPIGSMVLLYMVTFTINIPHMLAYIPYMDPTSMGVYICKKNRELLQINLVWSKISFAECSCSGHAWNRNFLEKHVEIHANVAE